MTGGDVAGGAVGGGAVTGGGATGGGATGGGAAGGVVTGVEDGSADPPSPTAEAADADPVESVTRPINPEEAMASGVGTTAAGASTPGRPIAGTHGAPVNAAIKASR
ncbi:MAG TPA: hypothetical protein VID94_07055 [Acidimicrobiales bacterium]